MLCTLDSRIKKCYAFLNCTCRFFYTKNKCYLSLIYTHPDYRGKKICYNHIKKIINLYKDTIKKYDLHVDKDNIPFLLIKT